MSLFLYMFIFSQDMEDSVVCGGAAWSGCVYGEHVPAGTAARPRTARVRSLQSPAHSQQGTTEKKTFVPLFEVFIVCTLCTLTVSGIMLNLSVQVFLHLRKRNLTDKVKYHESFL